MLSSRESESDNPNSVWSIFTFDTYFNFLFSHFLSLQWHICKTSWTFANWDILGENILVSYKLSNIWTRTKQDIKVWECLTREVSKYLFIERKLGLECFEVAKLFQAGHPTFCKHALRIFFFKMDVHINRVTSNDIQILRNKSLYVWNVKSTWLQRRQRL